MKFIIGVTLSAALVLAQTGADALSQLNQKAYPLLEAYELDKAEPLLEEAVALARKLGPAQELAAIVRLTDLYRDMQKRDGRNWLNLSIPFIVRGIEVAKANQKENGNQLAAQLALGMMELPLAGQPELSATFSTFLERWIAEIESTEGPLSARTAFSYEALLYDALGSEARAHALQACDVWTGSTEPAPPEFAALLLDCAEIDLHALGDQRALTETRAARKAVVGKGRRYAYDVARSYVVEAEAHLAVNAQVAATSALDSAAEVARKSLAASHPLWDRIQASRKSLPSGPTHPETRPPQSPRIVPAKVLSKVAPEYTRQARSEQYEGTSVVAVIITPDGKGKVFNVYRPVPYGLDQSVEKAITAWTFQPWTKDGKAVTGVSLFDVKFQLKN